MFKKVMAIAAVSLTALMLLPADPADARRGIRGGGGFRAPAVRARVIGVRSVHVRRVVRIHRPIRAVRRVHAGPVLVAGGSCEWLRRRAIITGSPYWWRRYRICRGW